ncbi:TonB-dependent receptor [Ancylomarina euxinus]|uniref:TonB-dependent receptor n=1 Tax=Ancylomarina euxinus TaxID=2283627 RepID=A0A425XYL1_9BACT|nr:TonB-dependent receptor [Ancylomarina euxinus]MCZ4695796.1 TonB-dependent receptor [Ancylomarina euxinus]MUP16141.1 TonB-dependent receptor [Ancylomarina euxinus]RRG19861.1 TonB-dependent receptor [Ancylomarina euxinus]
MNPIKPIIFCLVLLPILAISQETKKQDTLIRYTLETINVKASRIESTFNQLPYAYSVLKTKQEDQFKPQLSLQEFINQIPGLYSQNANNFAQDLRISIRGFGSRSAFGIRGIKLIIDGIPETTPDGQGQLDNLNLGIIKQIEVIRGAASSLYGNASGGVIAIQTKKNFAQPFSKLRTSIGAFAMQNHSISTGFGIKRATYFIHGAYTSSNAYREHSRFKQYAFNTNVSYILSSRYKLNIILNYLNSPVAQDPGGLNMEEVKTDRQQARNTNLQFKTEESVKQLKIGLALKGRINVGLDLDAYTFLSYRDFIGKLPFEYGGLINLYRNYGGHGASLTYKNSKNKFKLGYDINFQSDNRKRYENLDGFQGNITLNQQEKFGNIGLYLLDHFSSGRWNLTGGFRFDWNKLKAQDRILIDGDQSDILTYRRINPSLRFAYNVINNQKIFTGISTSFETPSLSELSANPQGEQGFNHKLKPQTAVNYEIGLKGQISEQIYYQFNYFFIKTKNDLVPYEIETSPGRSFYRNAGKTNRNGLEFEMTYRPNKNWKLNTSYTFSNIKYKDYWVGDSNFKGNYLPGIPKKLASISLEYQSQKDFYINFQTNYIGSLYADDANTVKIPSYFLSKLNLGYSHQYKGLTVKPFLGISNLFNQKYNDNIRINAFGQRYFEPAPNINIYAGILLKI